MFAFFLSVLLWISHPALTDQREILHGGLAASQTGLLQFWGDSPRDGRTVGISMRRGQSSES